MNQVYLNVKDSPAEKELVALHMMLDNCIKYVIFDVIQSLLKLK